MTELIARNEEEYINLVVRLVEDRTYRETIKEKMIVNRHVLFDDLLPIRALEQFLIERVNANKANLQIN